ncbi:hypothetical protein ACHAXS_001988 [Conticribra weissflogii]
MIERYLLLGEGDFTYSLDMCRYLSSPPSSSSSSSNHPSPSPSPSPVIVSEQEEPNEDDTVRDNVTDNDDDDDDANHREDDNDHDDDPIHGDKNAIRSYSVTCTGLDTHAELTEKYKDVDVILRRLRRCHRSSSPSASAARLTTRIVHGVHAADARPDAPLRHFDRVLFHHPHLGTEDAARHSRFLHHFFRAAVTRWLRPGCDDCGGVENDNKDHDHENGNNNHCNNNHDNHNNHNHHKDRQRGGLLYLTLVAGQCRRWNCLRAAAKQGLVLLRRGPFLPPPPASDAEAATRYLPRRHQSGKSFAQRRRSEGGGESETLVFGRACDYSRRNDECHDDVDVGCLLLPWEEADTKGGRNGDPSHRCRYCGKSFGEWRSLRNHWRCSHPDSEEARAAMRKKQTRKSNKKQKKEEKKKEKQEIEKIAADADVDVDANKDGDGDLDGTSSNGARDNDPTASNATNKRKLDQPNDNDGNDDGEIIEGPPWICRFCQPETPTTRMPSEPSTGTTQNSPTNADAPLRSSQPPRVFPHKRALLDHQRAKHFGDHVDIKPDWYDGRGDDNRSRDMDDPSSHAKNDSSSSSTSFPYGSCPICDLPFLSEQMKLDHEIEFVPETSWMATTLRMASSSVSSESSTGISLRTSWLHSCLHCSKPFRELRARLQHENFCSARTS